MISVIASVGECITGVSKRTDGDLEVTCPLHGVTIIVTPDQMSAAMPVLLSSVN